MMSSPWFPNSMISPAVGREGRGSSKDADQPDRVPQREERAHLHGRTLGHARLGAKE